MCDFIEGNGLSYGSLSGSAWYSYTLYLKDIEKSFKSKGVTLTLNLLYVQVIRHKTHVFMLKVHVV